jgi:hypothetical protein
VWSLHKTCEQYGQRPSRVAGIRGNWLSWMFDEAVGLYGRFVEGELARTDKNGKPTRTLSDILERGRARRQGTLEGLIAIMGTGE